MQIYKCRHISVQKQIFSYLLLFFSTTFMKKIWQTRHLHAASHITDINTNVCSIIRLLSGNWLICHVDHVNIRKSFMYVIEVDFTDVIAPSKECLKKSVKRSCMSLWSQNCQHRHLNKMQVYKDPPVFVNDYARQVCTSSTHPQQHWLTSYCGAWETSTFTLF